MFLHVQNTQILKMDNPYFFQVLLFFYQRTCDDEFYFYNLFEHIWFKSAFDLENYEF
jgi:hypothetical protein